MSTRVASFLHRGKFASSLCFGSAVTHSFLLFRVGWAWTDDVKGISAPIDVFGVLEPGSLKTHFQPAQVTAEHLFLSSSWTPREMSLRRDTRYLRNLHRPE